MDIEFSIYIYVPRSKQETIKPFNRTQKTRLKFLSGHDDDDDVDGAGIWTRNVLSQNSINI